MTASVTHDPTGARAHARAQGGVRIETMPILPPSTADHLPEGVDPARMLWAETVAGGGYTALTVAAGTLIELTDLEGDACAHLALFNAVQTDERLNLADTVKVQWQAYLSAGSLLLSDRGRVLASILADGSAHHDTFAGTSNRRRNEERYGDGSPQGGTPAGLELLTLAAAKCGLAPRDLPPTVALFQGVRVEPDGAMRFTGSAGPGAGVRLRAELPLVLLLANVPHSLDPREQYVSTPLRVRAWSGAPAESDAPEATATPEAARAFANTIAYARLRGIR
ncbi:urea amidolyase associated protein UAAP1 [Herbiconiux sp. 11R-BC]|uniref:urea amidolyase associated protein UAAP1 n=1 Tax=Herbiconiux sp. 11R-BC TaxID=3111637 RepID=UPI003C090E92